MSYDRLGRPTVGREYVDFDPLSDPDAKPLKRSERSIQTRSKAMDVSEDGTVTGSVDVSKLDEVDPKSDEAKAQLEQLKAQRDAGNKEADKAAEDSLKAAEAQTHPVPEDKGTTRQSTPVGDPNPPVQSKKASESEPKLSDKKG